MLEEFQEYALGEMCLILSKNLARDWSQLETRLDVCGQARARFFVRYPAIANGVVSVQPERFESGELKGFAVKIMPSLGLKFERSISLVVICAGKVK